MNRKLNQITMSDFYWGLAIIFSMSILIYYQVSGKKLFVLLLAMFVFIIGLFINHSKIIRERLDYEQENKK